MEGWAAHRVAEGRTPILLGIWLPPQDSPGVQDGAREVSEVLEYRHRILQSQDLLFLVFKKCQGKPENDLWNGQGSVRREAPGALGPRDLRHAPTGKSRAFSCRKADSDSLQQRSSPTQTALQSGTSATLPHSANTSRQEGTQNRTSFISKMKTRVESKLSESCTSK